ncbi:MAG: hypothetical protein ACJ70N_00065 [Nitrososphaera sp.]
MDTNDDILWDIECNNVCINDVVYGIGSEPCSSRAAMAGETANADARGVADTQSADNDNGIASSAGADISTEESSGFDTIGGDFGGDFEF